MTEPLNPREPNELENRLDRLYTSAVPDPLFAARLERQLLTGVAELKSPTASLSARRPRLFEDFFRRPLLVGAATVLLAILVTFGLIGPQKVLAEVQRLLGCLPNVGFVQPGQTLFLSVPVEVSQANFTLRVESVSVDQKSTRIMLTVSGLPHEKFTSPADNATNAELLLPDGSRLALTGSVVTIGDNLRASLAFPTLPSGVDRFTLLLPRLPSLPDRIAPENWSVPLVLQSTASTPSAAAGATSSALLVQPYVPENASAEGRGVTVHILQAAQTAQEIGIQLQYTWQDPSWTQLSGNPGSLSDETSRQYPVNPSSIDGVFGPEQGTDSAGLALRSLRFAAPTSLAKRLTLTVEQAWFNVRQDISFSFDPGPGPKVGQTWDLSQVPDMNLKVAGIPFKLLSASLQLVLKTLGDPDPKDVYELVFLAQSTPQNGLSLVNVNLELPFTSGGSSLESLPGGQFRMAIDLPAFLDHPLTLHIPRATLAVTGPWKIEWTPPTK